MPEFFYVRWQSELRGSAKTAHSAVSSCQTWAVWVHWNTLIAARWLLDSFSNFWVFFVLLCVYTVLNLRLFIFILLVKPSIFCIPVWSCLLGFFLQSYVSMHFAFFYWYSLRNSNRTARHATQETAVCALIIYLWSWLQISRKQQRITLHFVLILMLHVLQIKPHITVCFIDLITYKKYR